jgi:hypothetical protein
LRLHLPASQRKSVGQSLALTQALGSQRWFAAQRWPSLHSLSAAQPFVQTVSPPHRQSAGVFVQIAVGPVAAQAASLVQISDGSGRRQIPQPAN